MITGYNPETKTFSVSITELIAFRRLPVTLVPSETPLDLRARNRLHSSFQRKLCKEGYEREISVEYCRNVDGINFRISGRIDLIRESGNELEIIEVKTLPNNTEMTVPPTPQVGHLLQLCFYTLALRENEQWNNRHLKPTLTYIVSGTKPLNRFDTAIDMSDPLISAEWEQTLIRIAGILNTEDERRSVLMLELQTFAFPYSNFRPGQKRMIDLSVEAVNNSSNLILQAPTGTGKTAAVLTGVMPEVIRKRLALFFLTAKNTHKIIVLETVELIIHNALNIRTIFLTAREQVCLSNNSSCNPVECPFADKFASRVESSGVIERLLDSLVITRDNLMKEAEKAEVCPFELGLELALRCDVIVCDYNYAFDPHVYLHRFFDEKTTSGMCVLLIDEAANLPERARGYYSPEIKLSLIDHLQNALSENIQFTKLLHPWIDLFDTCSSLLRNQHSLEMSLPEDVIIPLQAVRWKKAISSLPNRWSDELRSLVRSVNDFIRIGPEPGERYKLLFRSDGADRILQWFCMDPAEHLGDRIKKCYSTLAFSATLNPIEYYRELLGLPDDDKTIREEIPWPFPSESLRVLIDPTIDTRYKYRMETAYMLAQKLLLIHRSVHGTWLVFFPSYAYLELIAGILEGMNISFISQVRGMSADERIEFITRIETGNELVLVVSGGIFSEGVDFRCSTLRGAVVISPSLPGIDLRAELLRKYYTDSGHDGFLRTMAIPGMTRVIQAAGRLVRSKTQRRILILTGRRFGRPPYFDLLPKHWFSDGKINFLSGALSQLSDFEFNKEGDA